MMQRREFIKKSGFIAGLGLVASAGACTIQKKRKTIVLWSGWDTVNIGDIGHTPGLLSLLQKYLPDVRIILIASTMNPAIRSMLEKRFGRIEIVVKDIFGDKILEPDIRDILGDADLFIRNSNTGSNTEYIHHLNEMGIPVGIFGQSLFPWFADGDAGILRVNQINKADFVYCRESITLQLLKNNNVQNPLLRFVPDACFGIDVRDDEGALGIMNQFGLEDKKFITIQLRTHTQSHDKEDMPPGYGPWKPIPENIPLDSNRAEKFIRLIVDWVDRTGNKVLIAPEAKKEMAANKRFIYDQLPERIKSFVVNLDRFWNVDTAASVFSRAHTVICHEPHSPVIALANGTPVIHTYSDEYGPKYHMFRDIGLSEWLMEHDSTPADKMSEALFGIENDYILAQSKVKASMDKTHNIFRKAMQEIAQVLDGPSLSKQ